MFFCCALKYHAANFLIGGCESFEKWPWFLANVAGNACQDLAALAASLLVRTHNFLKVRVIVQGKQLGFVQLMPKKPDTIAQDR